MDKKLYKFVYLLVFSLSVLRKTVYSSLASEAGLTRGGDVIFGAVFPIHRKDSQGDCKLFNKDALLWIRALNYAMDELQNIQVPALQNTTFGFHIKDTCTKPPLEQALEFVYSTKSKELKNNSSKVLAVLSSHYDKDSSTLFSLFGIPNMIFSDLNCGELGSHPNKHNYNFESVKMTFYRTKAVVGLLKYFKWDSVFVIVGERYKKEYLMFKQLAEIEGICIAGTSKRTEGAVENIKSLKIRTVVLYTDGISMLDVIRDMMSVRPSQYVWIDVIGNAQTMTSEFIMTGEIILSLRPEFNFLYELRKYVNPYCEADRLVGCQQELPEPCEIDKAGLIALEEVSEILSSKNAVSLYSKLVQDRVNYMQGVLNGVFTIGKALSRSAEAQCLDKTKIDCLQSISGKDLASELEFLSRNQFLENISHQKPLLKKNLFSLISYSGNDSRPREVGTWENVWFINHATIHWPGGVSRSPISTCSPSCPVGFVQVAEEGRKCCWSCQACNYNQYMVDNNTCADCVRGYWPSSDYRSCEFKIQVTLMSCAVAISSVSAVLYALVL